MRRVLMVAYHFPPFAGSSGVQRALRFASYLPAFGWEPIVLTAHRRAYEQLSDDLLDQLPQDLKVIRAPAWDAKRHLAVAGRYPSFLARPDRWRTWWLGAVPAGLRAIRHFLPHALWSTFPIPTAHSVGATLVRLGGLPWIADFRDPMAQDGYPPDPATWRSFDRIERRTIDRANLATVTTPSALRLYRERYPGRAAMFRLLENGYEESVFENRGAQPGGPLNVGRLTILHSGVVYPEERNPSHLFEALGRLRASNPDLLKRVIIRFRAPGHADLLKALIERNGVHEAVEILPPIPYAEAIDEMCRADGLLLLQAGNCNAQIPAKFYEYMRARRPILLLTDPAGDTAHAARGVGVTAMARLDDASSIERLLNAFCTGATEGMSLEAGSAEQASRRARTKALSELLDEIS